MALRPAPLVAVAGTPSADQVAAAKPVFITGLSAAVPAATTTVNGTVKKAATVANVTPAADGTAVGTAFNTLLTNLRAAGIIV